ncbi:hypothetical protein [Blastococcus sp. SYSU D01042]
MSGPPGERDPWSDPTGPVEPYPGPPRTEPPPQQPYAAPPPWGQQPYQQPYGAPPPWGQPAWGPAPYGPQPWGPPRERMPGQVVAPAVLAFVQAVVVLIASLYVWFFASVADIASSGRPGVYTSETARSLATEGTVLAVVQLASVVLLVAGGVLALNRRTPTAYRLLAGALVVQVVIALYWAGRLLDVLGTLGGGDGEGSLAAFSLFFLVLPAVALGLLLSGVARRWFTAPPA